MTWRKIILEWEKKGVWIRFFWSSIESIIADRVRRNRVCNTAEGGSHFLCPSPPTPQSPSEDTEAWFDKTWIVTKNSRRSMSGKSYRFPNCQTSRKILLLIRKIIRAPFLSLCLLAWSETRRALQWVCSGENREHVQLPHWTTEEMSQREQNST